MSRYRRSLVSFVRMLPMWLERSASDEGRDGGALEATTADRDRTRGESASRSGLKAIDGGLG
jgi:hypothetical protein